MILPFGLLAPKCPLYAASLSELSDALISALIWKKGEREAFAVWKQNQPRHVHKEEWQS